MNKSSIWLVVVALSFISYGSQAQFLQDNNGVAIRTGVYSDISGTPFFNKEWTTGTVKLKGGQSFKDVSVKFNDYEQFLVFKSPTGAELKFVQPVEEFTLNNSGTILHFRNLFNGPNSKGGNGFYEVVYDGGVPLYKRVGKDISEISEYGATGTTKTFVSTKPLYYSQKANGELVQLKADKKSVLSLFPEAKKSQIEAYYASHKIDFKDEEDLKKLFAHNNSL